MLLYCFYRQFGGERVVGMAAPDDGPAEAPTPVAEETAPPAVEVPATAEVSAAVTAAETTVAGAPGLPAAPAAPDGAPKTTSGDAQKPPEKKPEEIVAAVVAAVNGGDQFAKRQLNVHTEALSSAIRQHLNLAVDKTVPSLDELIRGKQTVDQFLETNKAEIGDKTALIRADLEAYQKGARDVLMRMAQRASNEQSSGWKDKLKVTFAAFGEVMKQLMEFLKDLISGFTGKSGEAAATPEATPPADAPAAQPQAAPAKKPAAKAAGDESTEDKPEVAERELNPHPGLPVPRDSFTSEMNNDAGSIKFTMQQNVAVRAIGEGQIISIQGDKVITRLAAPDGSNIFMTYEGIEPKGNIVEGMQLDSGTILGVNTEDLIIRTADAEENPVSPTDYMNLAI